MPLPLSRGCSGLLACVPSRSPLPRTATGMIAYRFRLPQPSGAQRRPLAATGHGESFSFIAQARYILNHYLQGFGPVVSPLSRCMLQLGIRADRKIIWLRCAFPAARDWRRDASNSTDIVILCGR